MDSLVCITFDKRPVLMHNDVKQCFGGLNVHCGSCTMASYSPEAGNLNGSNRNVF